MFMQRIYQLSLLAFLELDNVERNKKISKLKDFLHLLVCDNMSGKSLSERINPREP